MHHQHHRRSQREARDAGHLARRRTRDGTTTIAQNDLDLKANKRTGDKMLLPRRRPRLLAIAAAAVGTLVLALALASVAVANPSGHYEPRPGGGRAPPPAARRQLDLAAADQMDEPRFLDAAGGELPGEHETAASNNNDDDDDAAADQAGNEGADEEDESMAANSHEAAPERNGLFLGGHNSHLRAMRDMFARRQLAAANHHHQSAGNTHALGQSSQELSPISIELDPAAPFSMPPFPIGADMGGASGPPPPPLPNSVSGGPSLPFGLNPLPHLLGFPNSNNNNNAFDGPQRGDQSAHSNQHAAAAASSQANSEAAELGPGQKVWPKIFRFTDGRINLSDFEKQKKIRLSNKSQHNENHIESAPIMFDGRQLKRKSFLILHGGVFPGNRCHQVGCATFNRS